MPKTRRGVAVLGLAMVAAALAPVPGRAAAPDPAADVDPMIGTFAPGFVVPGAATPWGMVQNSPDTTGPFAYSGYLWSDPVIRGFSLVHLSGPGVKKAGDVPFTPWVGPLPRSEDPNLYASSFDHATESASPGAYSVLLTSSGTQVDLGASTRGAIQRYTFPPSPQSNVLVDIVRSAEGTSGRDGHVDLDPATRTISGWTSGRYKVFFAGQFDRPWTAASAWGAGNKGVALTFDTTLQRAVTLRVAVSFVDAAGAARNLAADAPDFDLAAMRGRARAAWNAELSRVRVTGGTVAARRTLYTSLYHSLLHPNVFEDADRRYLGFDGAVHVASGHVHYANFSSWDTYKSQNQLLATLWPERYRDMALSLLDDAAEGGTLPRWGEQNFDAAHMSGDPAIPLLADAACRGLLDDHLEDALAASLDLVSRRPPELLSRGWLPDRAGTTLEYGVADFALALLTQRAGDAAAADAALARSHNWRNLMDPASGWIRPRHADGSWAGSEPFDPTAEDGFQEGNSWQYSWLAPHDAADLFEAMGGVDTAVSRLDQLFAAPPEAQTRATGFGTVYRAPQYAPGNEHDLQVPWMYGLAGQPWRTADELREVQQVFRPTLDGLPGNDDLGGLSSWQVFSVLGFGPVVPGAPLFAVGAPGFDSVALRMGGGWFTVRTSGVGGYVQSASLNGKPLAQSWFEADKVRPGGSLDLAMGPLPSAWATGADARPRSARDGLHAFACE